MENNRPVSRQHVKALENQIAALESFIQRLSNENDSSRSELLSAGATGPNQQEKPLESAGTPSSSHSAPARDLVVGRAREGRMRKLCTRRKATQFYGGTSLFEIQLSSDGNRVIGSGGINQIAAPTPSQVGNIGIGTDTPQYNPSVESGRFNHSPNSDVCRELMTIFFRDLYKYNMCIYREYFLRDFAAGGGPYYSDVLMYSMCATAALVSEDSSLRALSPAFAKHATVMLYDSLELPELTTLQSLLVLGQLEIGQGRGSKGWLFCGMACRLTHEMGLHLDPNNWNSITDSSIDREILRRVYWAAFIVDKQLSLYFGRPPALYPHEADVRNTTRIPYPPEWETLLDTYLCRGTSATAFEDGVCLVGALIHQIELAKIFHNMIVDVFENRLHKVDTTVAAATANKIHISLVKWMADLPQILHWSQWTVGQVPPYVLHLHMLFHTGMIILHRPPRQHLDDDAVRNGEDVEICYESLAAILRLIRSYDKFYRFQLLPLDFVHTLSAAAGVLLMKRYLEKSSWQDKDLSKPMAQILDAMKGIENVWPCIIEIKEGILETMNTVSGTNLQQDNSIDFDLMGMLEYGTGSLPNSWLTGAESNSADLGFLVTDDFLNAGLDYNRS